jgi:hypothetical protein
MINAAMEFKNLNILEVKDLLSNGVCVEYNGIIVYLLYTLILHYSRGRRLGLISRKNWTSIIWRIIVAFS